MVKYLLILLIAVAPIEAQATVFWTDDFESALYPNWDTSNCGSPASSFPDGCNPSRSTTLSHSATHSFWSHFTNIDVQAGTFLDRHTTETQHLYMRFYYRTTAFTYNDIGTKHFYNTSDVEFMDLIWINSWGSRQMNATINHPATVTCPPTDRGGTTDTTCNYYPNLVAIDLNDNQWYCIETHVYVGSPGTANGVVEQWIDGVKTMNYTGLNIRTGSGGMNIIRHYAQVGLGDRYIDDLAVGDTRFNDCAGGGGGGGSIVMFIAQSTIAVSTFLQVLFIGSYFWQRRTAVVQAAVKFWRYAADVRTPKEMYWAYRYKKAVQRWQRNAPLMIEHQPMMIIEMPKVQERSER